MNIYIVVHVCFTIVSLSSTKVKPSNGVYVWLTVSPEVDNININGTKQVFRRRLQLNWNIAQTAEDAWIGLFDRRIDGDVSADEAILYVDNPSNEGTFRTKIEFPLIQFEKSNLSSECLGFWIAFISNITVIATNCIRSNPNWMRDNLIHIEDKSLKEIMIPGSHNAGSYYVGFNKGIVSTLKKYAICHDESVFNQLMLGIRYLDVRVSYEEVKGRSEKLWIAHGVLRMNATLDSVLLQVKQFLDATEKEIVILDFHRFEKGFDETNETDTNELLDRHRQVIKLLVKHLDDHLANNTSGYDLKIRRLLRDKKRVVVGHAKHRLFDERFLFPRVKHLWADTDDVVRLEHYFNRSLCNRSSNEPQSAMAQLTPTAWGVLFDKYGGIRKMSNKVNSLISKWFRERWWNCANIVAVDFVLSNDIIDTSIKANQLRNFVARKAQRRTRLWKTTV